MLLPWRSYGQRALTSSKGCQNPTVAQTYQKHKVFHSCNTPGCETPLKMPLKTSPLLFLVQLNSIPTPFIISVHFRRAGMCYCFYILCFRFFLTYRFSFHLWFVWVFLELLKILPHFSWNELIFFSLLLKLCNHSINRTWSITPKTTVPQTFLYLNVGLKLWQWFYVIPQWQNYIVLHSFILSQEPM